MMSFHALDGGTIGSIYFIRDDGFCRRQSLYLQKTIIYVKSDQAFKCDSEQTCRS